MCHRIGHRYFGERQRIEKALEDKEHLLKTILATSPVGIHLAENRTIKWADRSVDRDVRIQR